MLHNEYSCDRHNIFCFVWASVLWSWFLFRCLVFRWPGTPRLMSWTHIYIKQNLQIWCTHTACNLETKIKHSMRIQRAILCILKLRCPMHTLCTSGLICLLFGSCVSPREIHDEYYLNITRLFKSPSRTSHTPHIVTDASDDNTHWSHQSAEHVAHRKHPDC